MTTSYDTVYETQANIAIIKYNYQNALRKSQGTRNKRKGLLTLGLVRSLSLLQSFEHA